jgi:hypothetical protein
MPARKRARLVLGAVGLGLLLAACGHGTPAARPTITVTTTARASASPAATTAPVPPGIVAVTTAGALVVLNPATGVVSRDGDWLLYLAGHDLYVSHDGATPAKLASGLTAAGWS